MSVGEIISLKNKSSEYEIVLSVLNDLITIERYGKIDVRKAKKDINKWILEIPEKINQFDTAQNNLKPILAMLYIAHKLHENYNLPEIVSFVDHKLDGSTYIDKIKIVSHTIIDKFEEITGLNSKQPYIKAIREVLISNSSIVIRCRKELVIYFDNKENSFEKKVDVLMNLKNYIKEFGIKKLFIPDGSINILSDFKSDSILYIKNRTIKI